MLQVLVFAVALISCLRWLILAYQRYRQRVRAGCQPAPHYQHKSWFFPGNDVLEQQKEALQHHRFMSEGQEEFRKYGNTWQFSTFAGEFVNTIDPLNIEVVLADKDGNWGVSPIRSSSVDFFGKGVFTEDGTLWRKARDLARPTISRSQYSGFDLVEQHVQNLIRYIPKDGSSVDLDPLLKSMMVDYSSHYFWGQPIGCQGNETSVTLLDTIDECLAGVGQAIYLRMFYGQLSRFIPSSKQYKQACRTVHDYAKDRIRWAKGQALELKEKAERIILVRELVKVTDDEEVISSNTVTYFAAGADTMAVTIANILEMLSKHPESMAIVRREIEALPAKTIALEQLQKMTYLRAVINESLRLYPVGPAAQRIALNDCLLPTGGGKDRQDPVFVRKGTTVVINYFALHRDESIWGSDAGYFKPTRWTDGNAARPWTYAPFGLGLRSCPGQQLAMANLLYILTRIFQEFGDIESRDSRPWKEKLASVLSNANGVNVAFKSGR